MSEAPSEMKALVQTKIDNHEPRATHFHELMESLDDNAWYLARCMWKACQHTEREPDDCIERVNIVLAFLEIESAKDKRGHYRPYHWLSDDHLELDENLFDELHDHLQDLTHYEHTLNWILLDVRDKWLRHVLCGMGGIAYWSAAKQAKADLDTLKQRFTQNFRDYVMEADEMLCILAKAKVLASDTQHVSRSMRPLPQHIRSQPEAFDRADTLRECLHFAKDDFQMQYRDMKWKASDCQKELNLVRSTHEKFKRTIKSFDLTKKKAALEQMKARRQELARQMEQIQKDIEVVEFDEDDSSLSEDETDTNSGDEASEAYEEESVTEVEQPDKDTKADEKDGKKGESKSETSSGDEFFEVVDDVMLE